MPPNPHRDITSAAAAAKKDNPAQMTRQWLLGSSVATLCTIAAEPGLSGFPSGSVVPFSLDSEGAPVIFVAGIAAHTKNMRKDDRVTLFVRQAEGDGDPQAGWRVSIMGRMRRVVLEGTEVGDEQVHFASAEELEQLHARYRWRVPAVDRYASTHGFSYWKMCDIEKVRFIAGFGKICWFAGHELLRDPTGEGVGAGADRAIAHMNADHGENMREMCHGMYGFSPEKAEMTLLERDGFMLRTAPDKLHFFPFGDEITGSDIRASVVGVLSRARERGAGAQAK